MKEKDLIITVCCESGHFTDNNKKICYKITPNLPCTFYARYYRSNLNDAKSPFYL